MAPPALHVFPPPTDPRSSRQISKRKDSLHTPSPISARSKSPNFQEVVLQVTSDGTNTTIAQPPRAHMSPQDAFTPTFPLPTQDRTRSPMSRVASPPARNRAVSPAFSEWPSERSASATLVRSSTPATNTTPPSPAEAPAMRSMFPQYDPTRNMSQQIYSPVEFSLPPQIPKNTVNRTSYYPLPPQTPVREAYRASSLNFTPAADLALLWDVANGQTSQAAAQIFSMPMHRSIGTPTSASSSSSGSPEHISFGPNSTHPFLTLSVTPDSPLNDTSMLVHRIHPLKETSIPIASLVITPEPDRHTPDHPSDPRATFITEINPNLAALVALDAAAQSPQAVSIATMDPQALSSQAADLAANAVADAFEREGCVIFRREPESEGVIYAQGQAPMVYELHHPTLGILPLRIDGDVGLDFPHSPAPIGTPRTRARYSRGGRIALLSPRGEDSVLTPQQLAVLDLTTGNGSLIIDAAAMMDLNNLYIVDVAVCALLAVALAESKRRTETASESGFTGASDWIFAPPPKRVLKGAAAKTKAKAAAREERRRESSSWGMQGLAWLEAANKHLSTRGGAGDGRDASQGGDGSAEGGIEMTNFARIQKIPDLAFADVEKGMRARQRRRAQEEGRGGQGEGQEGGEWEMPRLTRGILMALTLVFKTAIWVLGVGVRVVGGLVLWLSRKVILRQ